MDIDIEMDIGYINRSIDVDIKTEIDIDIHLVRHRHRYKYAKHGFWYLPLYWALEPECRILEFTWSSGPLICYRVCHYVCM